jgi:hypothetical protein
MMRVMRISCWLDGVGFDFVPHGTIRPTIPLHWSISSPAHAGLYPQQSIANYKSYWRYRKEIQEILGTEIRFSISALNAVFGSQAARVWE